MSELYVCYLFKLVDLMLGVEVSYVKVFCLCKTLMCLLIHVLYEEILCMLLKFVVATYISIDTSLKHVSVSQHAYVVSL
jgi:hypothetical protein